MKMWKLILENHLGERVAARYPTEKRALDVKAIVERAGKYCSKPELVEVELPPGLAK